MKKNLIVLSLFVVIALGQTAYAAGPGQGQALHQQTTTKNICVGSPETITGIVTGAWVPGAGLTIEGDSGTVTVFGLGPVWYWDANNIDRPDLGEFVSVDASGVIYTTQKVILSLTIDGQTLQLRDPSTCLPVWRGLRTR